ncbi:hypothetical protein BU17DRAFT_93614 [Hysterangium stoloniferum]|nr:hypothetical protein BU17DRAFT_93614 [Hysterangium stoloniferum]
MLQFVSTFVSQTIPSHLYVPVVTAVLLLAVIYAYTQGRRTNRDRILDAKRIILTGAFTPLGLTLLEFLAKKGAHIIVLLPTPLLTSHQDEILNLLRTTTSNDNIYAEPCPLNSLDAIINFCGQFTNTEDESTRRIDALILAHEYSHIGLWGTGIGDQSKLRDDENRQRDEGAMATFQLITLLLPAMLVAPIERDIRIINVVNPFYAAAAPKFDPRLASALYSALTQRKGDSEGSDASQRVQSSSIWSLEGQRALRTAVFTRHLQRILDALPEPGAAPDLTSTDVSSSGRKKNQKSNIMAVTVCPGISRTDTIASCILAPSSSQLTSVVRQWLGALSYVVLLPLLHLFSKSPTAALQTVLHALCVPKPITRRHVPVAEDAAQVPRTQPLDLSQAPLHAPAEEVLVPGALYTDCAVVGLCIHPAETFIETLTEKVEPGKVDVGLDDECLGRAVWEVLEVGITTWKARARRRDTEPRS